MIFSKSLKQFSFILIASISLISCNKNENDQIITEPSGSAEYFIKNQSNKNIVIIYQKSEELGLEIDTSGIIGPNSSMKILEDGIIGVNPVPENSFKEMKLYESSDLNNPLSILSPIQNEDWTITDQNIGDSGYGLTIYEITYIDESPN